MLRQTIRKRLHAKLQEVKAELRRRMHHPIREQGAWLRSVVSGHVRYYGVPTNTTALGTFRWQVGRLWLRTLRRRSQHHRLPWTRMQRLIDHCSRRRASVIPHRCGVLASLPKVRAGCGQAARPDLWRGCSAMGIPTPTRGMGPPTNPVRFILGQWEFWDSSETEERDRGLKWGKILRFSSRGVAQPGSAPALGAGGRWFESSRPDQNS